MSSPHRDEYLKKKRNKRILRFSVIFLILICIIALASYVSHRPTIRISKVELSGGILLTQSDVQSETLSFVSGSYLWLFPKNNVFWYPHKALIKDLRDKFQRIDTIDIHLKDFHTLAVEITERKPTAIWCTGEPEMQPSGSATDRERRPTQEQGSIENSNSNVGSTEDNRPKCYFLDQNGTIFSEAPDFSGDAYFKKDSRSC